MSGATVVLSRDASQEATLVDSNGRFALDVAPGDYTLSFYYNDAAGQLAVSVGDGAHETIPDIVFDSTAVTSGEAITQR